MKNTIKQTLAVLACLAALFACEKETTPEPVRIQSPDVQSPILRDNAYYARLRAYKQTDHSLAFGWFGSWTAIGPSEQCRLTSAPDSMDIISMWSKWNDLNEEQIADKAFVQQILGTKVVICISAKSVPDEFLEEGEITETSLVNYARAWGRDSMDKYQYDGIDIDYETAVDHTGPLNQDMSKFRRFCYELSRYIGPKSGTGRLFLLDGNINTTALASGLAMFGLTDEQFPGIAEICNYGVSQAYACSTGSNLASRTSSAQSTAGWRPEQLIFTENFESYWSAGGVSHTTTDGYSMESLLGMAYFARYNTSCGFGAYHMEYEYGHSDMPYKYMRRAIQLANPAPQGDWTKNLVTLAEAGEYAYEIAVFPSGASEPFLFSLSGSLTGVPSTAADIPLMVDNSLVEAYNQANYTEYKAVDPALVRFSAPMHFAAGEQQAEAPVVLTLSDASSFGKDEYLVPVRFDFSNTPGYSANTVMEICYFKLKTFDAINTLTLPGDGAVTSVTASYTSDGTLVAEPVCSLQAQLAYRAAADVDFTVTFDPSLVEAYNSAHGTSYPAMARSAVSVPSQLSVQAGADASDAVEIRAVDPESLTSSGELIALRVDLGGNVDYGKADNATLILYYLFRKEVNNIAQNATSIDGTPIEDMTGWTYSGPSVDSSTMFNGDTTDWGWYAFYNTNTTVTVDMTKSYRIAGFRIAPFYGGAYGYMYKVYDVQTSIDGSVWIPQSTESAVSLAAPDENNWQYVRFFAPVECRYVRLTYKGTYGVDMTSYYVGSDEFGAVEAN